MTENTYLPSESEWEHWFNLELSLGYDDIINPEVMCILIACLEYQLEKDRPPTLEELYEHMNMTCSHFFPQLITINSNSLSTRSQLLRILEKKQIIKIFSVQEWRKKYGPIKKKLHGKAALYALTAKGAILHEMMLLFPFYSFSILPSWQTKVSAIQSALTWALLTRKKRYQLSPVFFEKENLFPGKYESELLKKISKALGSFETSFWKMSNPSAQLVREAKSCQAVTIIHTLPDILNSSKSSEFSIEPLIAEFLIQTTTQIRDLAAYYNNSMIKFKWEKLGHDFSILPKIAPIVSQVENAQGLKFQDPLFQSLRRENFLLDKTKFENFSYHKILDHYFIKIQNQKYR